jgi:hypothetical protein
MQNNVRNAETDILRYLYSEIYAGAFKFNKLEAIVIPNSNYIVRGNNYEAKVSLHLRQHSGSNHLGCNTEK